MAVVHLLNSFPCHTVSLAASPFSCTDLPLGSDEFFKTRIVGGGFTHLSLVEVDQQGWLGKSGVRCALGVL